MATDIKETTRQRTDEARENTVMGADLVTGAAVTVADNVARVVNHPAREARKLEHRGAEANRQFGEEVSEIVEDATDKAGALMPEKLALAGIRVIKSRARRKDLVGEVAYRTLWVANRGLGAVLGTMTRFERATQPPARAAGSHAKPVAKPAARRSRTRRSSARTRRGA
jgi:hypothetical protein